MTEIPLIESNLFNFFEIKKQYKPAKVSYKAIYKLPEIQPYQTRLYKMVNN